MAQALNWLGRAAIVDNEYPRAVELCRESLALWQQSGDVTGAAETLFNLGLIAWRQGNDIQAIDLFEQSLAMAQVAGNKRHVMIVNRYLGLVVHRQADYERSHTLFASCLALAHELAEMDHMAAKLHELGDLVQAGGQVKPAYEYYLQSLSLAEIGGDRWFINWIRHDLEQVKQNEIQSSEGTWLGDSSALFQKPDHELDVVTYLIGLAGTAKQVEQAAQLLGAAHKILQGDAGQLQWRDQAEFELIVATVRAQLDEVAFARAWENGRSLTPEQAVALALKPQ
jgi:tetratricopeptide (TPR) repeat protein